MDEASGIADGGGNDGAATVASAVVVMTTFFRNVPGLVRDVTQRRQRCRRRVAAMPHHDTEKTGFPVAGGFWWRHWALHQDGRLAITGNAVARRGRTSRVFIFHRARAESTLGDRTGFGLTREPPPFCSMIFLGSVEFEGSALGSEETERNCRVAECNVVCIFERRCI